MAKIVEENIVITISKVVKNNHVEETTVINEELITTLETVAQELLGDAWIVEVRG